LEGEVVESRSGGAECWEGEEEKERGKHLEESDASVVVVERDE